MTRALLLLLSLAACGPKTGDVEPLGAKSELAPAAAVFERYLRASSHDNPTIVQDIQSSYTTMTMEIPAMGMTAQTEMWWVAPNKMLVQTKMEGMGTIIQGFDGEHGWMVDDTMGPRLLEGEELIQLKFQSDPYGDLNYNERYSSLETVRKTDLAGEPVWEVKAVPKDWDTEIHYFFSTETGLLVGTEQEVASPLGKMKATTRFFDYRDVDGMLTPYRSEQKVMGINQVITIDSVELNPPSTPPIEVPPELLAP